MKKSVKKNYFQKKKFEISSYYLEDHYKKSHPGVDTCPIVMINYANIKTKKASTKNQKRKR